MAPTDASPIVRLGPDAARETFALTVEAGWNRLAGTDPDAIAAAAGAARPPADHPPLYGDGHAADLIADVICTMERA